MEPRRNFVDAPNDVTATPTLGTLWLLCS